MISQISNIQGENDFIYTGSTCFIEHCLDIWYYDFIKLILSYPLFLRWAMWPHGPFVLFHNSFIWNQTKYLKTLRRVIFYQFCAILRWSLYLVTKKTKCVSINVWLRVKYRYMGILKDINSNGNFCIYFHFIDQVYR